MNSTDFAEIWDDMFLKSKEQKAGTSEHGDNYWDIEENVDRFVKRLMFDDRGRVKNQLNSMNIPKGSTVLDIGSGPGTLSVPLTKEGCSVTVVEPSISMIKVMRKYMETSGVSGIREINSTWEDAKLSEIGKHDYAVASLSLMMGDIKNSLAKMNDAAEKEVHLFWFLTPPSKSRGNIDLWPKIHGEPYCHEPTADLLWNVLFRMGIYANITVETRQKSQGYPTLEILYDDYYSRMAVKKEEDKKIIQEYLKGKIIKTDNGFAVPSSTVTAHIWWEKQ